MTKPEAKAITERLTRVRRALNGIDPDGAIGNKGEGAFPWLEIAQHPYLTEKVQAALKTISDEIDFVYRMASAELE